MIFPISHTLMAQSPTLMSHSPQKPLKHVMCNKNTEILYVNAIVILLIQSQKKIKVPTYKQSCTKRVHCLFIPLKFNINVFQ